MRRKRGFIGVASGTALLVALSVATSAGAQEESKEIKLSESRNSGVSGKATFDDEEKGVEVKLELEGAPKGGVEHLAHIHEGATCEDDRNDQGGPVEFPLESVEVKDDGKGSSTTALEDTKLSQLFESGKQRYVNVHAEKTGGGVPPGISCADLTLTSSGGKQDASKLPKSGGASPTALLLGVTLSLGIMVALFALRRARS